MPNNIKLHVKEKFSTSTKYVGKAIKRKYITTNFIFLPSKTKRKKKKKDLFHNNNNNMKK